MKIYLDLFLTGLALSWGICSFSCAPIVAAYIVGTKNSWRGGLQASLIFSLARIIPYIILSVISAKIGQYLVSGFFTQTHAGVLIYAVAGVFVFFLGLIIILGKFSRFSFCARLKQTADKRSMAQMVFLGLIIGFSPCLPLFGVLTYIAFSADNSLQAALLGLAFGLGTLLSPLVLMGPLAGASAQFLARRTFVYNFLGRFCGLFLIYLGLKMIFKVLPVLRSL